MLIAEDIYLKHYGTKGMRWGVRTQSKGSERKAARKEVAAVTKSARSAIKAHRKAGTNTERKAAAVKYEKEVLNKVKSKEFKKAYAKANTMGKGEMVTQALVFGPLAALTIPAIKEQYADKAQFGLANEVSSAKLILKELKS